jgi:hypothetical protein
MTTFDRLQQLSDGEFHSLCDDLLCRLEPRYRRLRTHGLNPDGVSIKGQPDSYVGDTAATCTIAFQYSVDKGDWWNKIIDDVRDAVKVSPGVQEIVVATPRNIDRDGPKQGTFDWLSKAKAEAGKATLQPPYDGRDIARLLNDEHQDLRFKYLQIPYSRLSALSILASCKKANGQAIEELEASGRYDPARYATRDADRRLFELWQRALRPTNAGGSPDRNPVRLIALVNDSGVGKTSLLAAFVRSLGTAIPAVLLQARNLAFASEDSLVTHVVQAIQGVMDPISRSTEESAIVYHLAAGLPLVVVLDGLDEAKDAYSVRRAINYWLKSRVGQMSILVVSSRPEFWKMCVDRGWRAWMPSADRDDRNASMVESDWSVEVTDPTDGTRIPDKFTAKELETAWIRAGQPRDRFFLLPSETREELRHPFTLRVYFDLLEIGGIPPQPTRADLLRVWLDRRLTKEVNPAERLTQEQFRQALVTIAARLAEVGGGCLSVDDLEGVPRFDATHPPGPVVERLLAANILESVPDQPDRIRFAVEAVQDFYRAEAEMAEIVRTPDKSAQTFAGLSFTEAYPRLARIGQLLVTSEARHRFVACLAAADACKAAVVVRCDPSKYASSLRHAVADALGSQITARHRVRGAFAIRLLGDLHCDESRTCLAVRLLPPAVPHSHLRMVGAEALVNLNHIAAIEFIYASPLFCCFSRDEAYYFKETLALMRASTAEFRTALADYALARLQAPSGRQDHCRAVSVLAYLGEDRLVSHLTDRLTENGSLLEYENHALIVLGTDRAGQVFCRSAKKLAQEISKLGYDDGGAARHELHSRVSSATSDHEYLYTPQVVSYIIELIHADHEDTAYLGYDLAMRSHVPSLIRHAVYALARWHWHHPRWREVGNDISPDNWLTWWGEATDATLRRELLNYLPAIPNATIEQVLVECLDSPDYRFGATQQLGRLGCCRSAVYLRQLVSDRTGDVDLWLKITAIRSLSRFRDQASVEAIETLVGEHPETNVAFFGIPCLGWIGTPEAEQALRRLLAGGADEELVVGGLLMCGSASAVLTAIELACSKPKGVEWLCKAIKRGFGRYDYRRGEFYRHISTGDLVKYTCSCEEQVGSRAEAIRALEPIDSEEVRLLLRRWASCTTRPGEPTVSAMCYEQLMLRGDTSAIPFCLDSRMGESDNIYLHFAADRLSHFPSEAVASELRCRFEAIDNDTQAIRLLSLLGRFGDANDQPLIQPYLDSPNDLVANVACESLLRLTDPMVVPENWREV